MKKENRFSLYSVLP